MNIVSLFEKSAQEEKKKERSTIIRRYRESINPPYSKKDFFPLFTTLFLLLAIPVTVVGVFNSKDFRSKAEVTPLTKDIGQQVLEKTESLVKSVSSKDPNLTSLKALAIERKKQMLVLARTNPKDFLKNSFSINIISEFPQEIQVDVEKPIQIEGILNSIPPEEGKDNPGETINILTNGEKSYYLNTSEGVLEGLSGNTVKVTGMVLDDQIVLASSKEDSISVIGEKKVLGVQTVKKVAVILLNFQDDKTEPITADKVRKAVFTDALSVNEYYKENSLGSIRLEGNVRTDGDVFGWFTLPINKSEYCGSLDQIKYTNNLIVPSAKSIGYDINNYRSTIFVFNSPNCSGNYSIVGGPYVWINPVSYISNFGVVAHELGHSFGLAHANSLKCVDNKGTLVAYYLETNCTSNEYGDPFDLMGGADWGIFVGHMNVSHKKDLGFLQSGNVLDVKTDGTYDIAPQEVASNSTIALRIPYDYWLSPATFPEGGVAKFFYLEYRQPIGKFETVINSSNSKGVFIRVVDYPRNVPDQHTKLLDMTPETPSMLDSALVAGKSFIDPIHGIKVTTLSTTSSSAKVEVSFLKPQCARAYPTMVYTSGAQWVNPGETATYNFSVTNNDSPGCGGSSYTFYGYLVTPTASKAKLLLENIKIPVEPGETKSGSFQIQTSSDTPVGIWDVYIQVWNASVNYANTAGSDPIRHYINRLGIYGKDKLSRLADLNGDGVVNIRDLSLLLSKWRTKVTVGDINGDGEVDIRDLSVLLSRWNR